MLILITLIAFNIIRSIDNSRRKVVSTAIIMSMGIHALSIDLSPHLIDGFYDLGYQQPTIFNRIQFIILWLPTILIIYSLAKSKSHDKIAHRFTFLNTISRTEISSSNSRRFKYLCVFLWTIALFALLTNINNVQGMEFDNPREYELEFGQNSVINYLYLLSTLCVVFSLFGLKSDNTLVLNKYWKVAFKISIVIFSLAPIFHGIKATPIHQWIFTIFIYYYLGGKVKYIFFYTTIVITLLIIFFSYVRGGSLDGIYAYFLLGYINLFQNLGQASFSEYFSICDFSNLLIPFSYISKCNNEFFWSNGGFFANDKYNHFTALQIVISSFGYLSFLWISFLLFLFMIFDAAYRKNLHNNKQSSILLLVFLGSTFVGFSLFFFSYTFFTLKWWWYAFATIATTFFIRKKIVW